MLPDERATRTVLGDGLLPIGPVADYLEFCREGPALSPSTIKAYAKGLERWFTFLIPAAAARSA